MQVRPFGDAAISRIGEAKNEAAEIPATGRRWRCSENYHHHYGGVDLPIRATLYSPTRHDDLIPGCTLKGFQGDTGGTAQPTR